MSEATITTTQALAELKQLKACAAALMRGRNLDDCMVAFIRREGPSDATLARLNMSEAVLKAPNLFKDPLAKDLHITGRASRNRRWRQQAVGKWDVGNTRKQETNLMYPASRPSRPRGLDGGRSFHMREVIIHPVTTTPGRQHDEIIPSVTATSRSQHKARHHYTLDASKVPLVEAMLDGQHLERGLYLSRSEVAAEHNEILLALTSMGPDEDAVVDQWRLIERTEMRRISKPIERHLSINLEKSTDPEFWRRLRAEDHIPDCLATFLDGAENQIRFTRSDSDKVEKFLRAHGWHDRTKKGKRPDVTFHRGKQPVAQRRLVFELPADLSLGAKERIIHQLAKEFLKRDLPFVLVVHKPDEHNHKSNWHIHVDYHHRPMRRFDPENYKIDPVPPPETKVDSHGRVTNPGKKAYEQYRIKCEALANADPSWTGKWDSEIEYEYRTPSGRAKTAFPFVQEIHPDFREGADWLKKLRTRYADIINAELQHENLPDRFDPRSFVERGIEKIPDTHLSNSKTRLERSGRPTLDGAMNEQCQWNYEVGELRKRFPGGDRPDGDPKAVAGFITGYQELLRARLRSRPQYINYFAKREADWDNQPKPTATSLKRNRRGDYTAERLMLESAQMLGRLDRIWPALTRGLQNLSERIRSAKHTTSAMKREALAQRDKPSDSKRGQHGLDDWEITAPPRKTNGMHSKPSQNDTASKGSPDTEVLSVTAAVQKLRDRSIHFELRMGYKNGQKILVAQIDEGDAKIHQLSRQLVARSARERADIMDLQNERMDATAKAKSSTTPRIGEDLPPSTKASDIVNPPCKREGLIEAETTSSSIAEPGTSSPATASSDGQLDAGTRARVAQDDLGAWMAANTKSIEESLKKRTTPPSTTINDPGWQASSAAEGMDSAGPSNNDALPRIKRDRNSPDQPVSKRIANESASHSISAEAAGGEKAKRTAADPPRISRADIERMETRPLVLERNPSEEFRFASIDAPSSLKAAAASGNHVTEFARWYERQVDEQREIAVIVSKSPYANRSQVEAAIDDAKANERLIELWARWNGTRLLTKAIEQGLEMRRIQEREAALEAERKREYNRQVAMAQNLERGF